MFQTHYENPRKLQGSPPEALLPSPTKQVINRWDPKIHEIATHGARAGWTTCDWQRRRWGAKLPVGVLFCWFWDVLRCFKNFKTSKKWPLELPNDENHVASSSGASWKRTQQAETMLQTLRLFSMASANVHCRVPWLKFVLVKWTTVKTFCA